MNMKMNMKRAIDPTDAALRADLQELLEIPVRPDPVAGRLLTGRVADTHHPSLPGRVLVRWRDGGGRPESAWLSYVRGTTLSVGDKVLLGRADNEPQWLVVGVLSQQCAPSSAEPAADVPQAVQLNPGQGLVVQAHDGTALLELRSDGGEVQMRLPGPDVTLAAAGRLRLTGRSVELAAGDDGVDVRTEKDVVVRGRHIRLN